METSDQPENGGQQPAAGLEPQQPQTGLPQPDTNGAAPEGAEQITAEQYLESVDWGENGENYIAAEVPSRILPEVQAEFARRHPEELQRRDLRYSDYQNKSQSAAEAQRRAGMVWDRQQQQYVPIAGAQPPPAPGAPQPGPLAQPPGVPPQPSQMPGPQYPQGQPPQAPQAPGAAPQFQYPENTVEGIRERTQFEMQQAVAPVIAQSQQLAANIEQQRHQDWVKDVVAQTHALAEKTPILQTPGAVEELLKFMDDNGYYSPEGALWAWKGKEMAQQMQGANTQAQQQNAQEPAMPPPSSGGPGQVPPATSNAEITARIAAGLKAGPIKVPPGRTT